MRATTSLTVCKYIDAKECSFLQFCDRFEHLREFLFDQIRNDQMKPIKTKRNQMEWFFRSLCKTHTLIVCLWGHKNWISPLHIKFLVLNTQTHTHAHGLAAKNTTPKKIQTKKSTEPTRRFDMIDAILRLLYIRVHWISKFQKKNRLANTVSAAATAASVLWFTTIPDHRGFPVYIRGFQSRVLNFNRVQVPTPNQRMWYHNIRLKSSLNNLKFESHNWPHFVGTFFSFEEKSHSLWPVHDLPLCVCVCAPEHNKLYFLSLSRSSI